MNEAFHEELGLHPSDRSEPAASSATTAELEMVRGLAYREAMRRFVSRPTAEDMAQTTVFEYHRIKPLVRRAHAWVRAVVGSLVQKRNRARNRREVHEVLFGGPTHDPSVERERQQLLRATLDRLPDYDRQLLEMALEGRSHAEIARWFDIPTSSVGARLARATERAGRACRHLRASSPKDFPPLR